MDSTQVVIKDVKAEKDQKERKAKGKASNATLANDTVTLQPIVPALRDKVKVRREEAPLQHKDLMEVKEEEKERESNVGSAKDTGIPSIIAMEMGLNLWKEKENAVTSGGPEQSWK